MREIEVRRQGRAASTETCCEKPGFQIRHCLILQHIPMNACEFKSRAVPPRGPARLTVADREIAGTRPSYNLNGILTVKKRSPKGSRFFTLSCCGHLLSHALLGYAVTIFDGASTSDPACCCESFSIPTNAVTSPPILRCVSCMPVGDVQHFMFRRRRSSVVVRHPPIPPDHRRAALRIRPVQPNGPSRAKRASGHAIQGVAARATHSPPRK